MSEIKKVKRKKGFKPVGIFLFGVLFGFLFTLTAIIGTGFWVYKNLTLNKIEKITKNEIDIGNESIKNLTIEDVVKNISGVVQNLDTYTIEQIEDDFNIVIVGEGGFIKEEMYGLDMTPLKKATKNTIKDVFQDIIGTASMQTVIENLGSNQDMGMFSTILDTEIEYYYNSVDKKLYAEYDGEYYSTPLEDNLYSLDGDKVKVGAISYDVTDGKISIAFKNVPISQAFNDFDKVTSSLEVGELLGYEKVGNIYYTDSTQTTKVSGAMKVIASKTIDDLSNENTINNLKIWEIMDYHYNSADQQYYTDAEFQTKVNGIMQNLAPKSIKDLNSDETFNNIYIHEVMNYTVEKSGGQTIYKDGSNTVTGIMKAIAGFKVGELEQKIPSILIADILELDGSETGVLKFIYTKGSTVESLESDIEGLKLGEALGINESDATGVIRHFFNTPINQLNANLAPDTLTVAIAMGYYENGGKYYTDADYQNEVTGVMATLASATLNNISTKINDIKATDILPNDSPILNLFDSTEKTTLTVGNLSSQLVNKINTATVGELYTAGLITGVEMDDTDTAWNLTLKQILDEVNSIP